MKSQSETIIDSILKLLDMKAPTFASNIGVAYQRIYDIQRGKTKRISTELAEKIVSAYPQINLSWILSGHGEMLNSQTKVTGFTIGDNNSRIQVGSGNVMTDAKKVIDERDKTIDSLKIENTTLKEKIKLMDKIIKDKERLIEFLEKSNQQ